MEDFLLFFAFCLVSSAGRLRCPALIPVPLVWLLLIHLAPGGITVGGSWSWLGRRSHCRCGRCRQFEDRSLLKRSS